MARVRSALAPTVDQSFTTPRTTAAARVPSAAPQPGRDAEGATARQDDLSVALQQEVAPRQDPVLARELWFSQIAAARLATQLGLEPEIPDAAAPPEHAGIDSPDQARTRALADALLVEYVVHTRRIPETLPDSTPGAAIEAHVRSIARRSVENANDAMRLKLLQWAQASASD